MSYTVGSPDNLEAEYVLNIMEEISYNNNHAKILMFVYEKREFDSCFFFFTTARSEKFYCILKYVLHHILLFFILTSFGPLHRIIIIIGVDVWYCVECALCVIWNKFSLLKRELEDLHRIAKIEIE